MDTTRFEQLVLAIGGATILGSLAVSLPTGSQPELVEIIAQLMLLGVLFAAVRYGRRGGAIAGSVAAILYVAMRVPELAAAPTSSAVSLVLVARILAFGLVGIVGGEACRHIRYSIARLEGGSALDEWSRVFNQAYFARQLQQSLGRSTRYGEPFTAVLITLSGSLFSELRPSRQRSLIRTLSDNLRSDIRMVDEVARLDDGRFAVLLPHTPKAGGEIVATRLASLTRSTLAARDEAVTVRALSAPDDEPELRSLFDEVDVARDQAASEA